MLLALRLGRITLAVTSEEQRGQHGQGERSDVKYGHCKWCLLLNTLFAVFLSASSWGFILANLAIILLRKKRFCNFVGHGKR